MKSTFRNVPRHLIISCLYCHLHYFSRLFSPSPPSFLVSSRSCYCSRLIEEPKMKRISFIAFIALILLSCSASAAKGAIYNPQRLISKFLCTDSCLTLVATDLPAHTGKNGHPSSEEAIGKMKFWLPGRLRVRFQNAKELLKSSELCITARG